MIIALQKTCPTPAFFSSAFQNLRNRSTYSSAFRNCRYRLTYYGSAGRSKPALSKLLLQVSYSGGFQNHLYRWTSYGISQVPLQDRIFNFFFKFLFLFLFCKQPIPDGFKIIAIGFTQKEKSKPYLKAFKRAVIGVTLSF